MTPAIVSGRGLLDDYLGHLQALGLGDRAVRDRVRIARDFTSRHPDRHAWMTLPVTERAGELKRTGAWPLVCYAIGTGRLRLDLELAGARNLAGLARAVEARDPEAFAVCRAAGLGLGWKVSWTETVLGECLAVLLAWHGGQVADLTSEIVDAFDNQLAACMVIPPSSRRAYRSRLAGVRQLLFETRVIDTPPRRRPWARTLEQRLADVAMAPQIRQVLLRYVRARAAVLRPKSVDSLVNDLLPFAEYLTASQPAIPSLRQLQRGHVEGYLTWNRTRPWRGQRAAAGNGRVVSVWPGVEDADDPGAGDSDGRKRQRPAGGCGGALWSVRCRWWSAWWRCQSMTSLTAERVAVSSTRFLPAAKVATRDCRARLFTARG